MRTFKFIDDVGGQESGERLFMLEHGFNGFVIGEDEPKSNFRVTVFEDFIQFFPHVIAR